MKNLYITLALLLIVGSHTLAQLSSEVDVAPLLINCEGSDQERVTCTTETLYQFITQEITNESCADLDTSEIYRASLQVNSNGKVDVKSPFEVYGQEGNPCTDYFNQKLETFIEEYEFAPALRDNNATEFTKRIEIVYPPIKIPDSLKTIVNDTFVIVEQMPRFSGCETMVGSHLDKETCAQTKMLMHIYKTLRYPPEARNKGIEGMVVIQFVVDTDGYLKEMEVVRPLGGGCDEAALEAMHSMNNLQEPPFVPGQQFGKPVKVLYTMPVRFKLEGGRSTQAKKKSKWRNRD